MSNLIEILAVLEESGVEESHFFGGPALGGATITRFTAIGRRSLLEHVQLCSLARRSKMKNQDFLRVKVVEMALPVRLRGID